MTEQTKNTNNVHTDFLDVFGSDQAFEVELDVDAVHKLLDVETIYVTAPTAHRAKLAVAEHIISRITKIGAQRVGKLAIAELARQREGQG